MLLCYLTIFVLRKMLSYNTIQYNLSYSFFSDTDECTIPERNECDPNAMCTNTEGSYVCRCKKGYSGVGKNCTGKSCTFMLLLVSSGRCVG